jgi:hypothetical protein
MDDFDFQRRFNEILARIEEVPPKKRTHLEALATEVQSRRDEVREALDRSNDAFRRLTMCLHMALLG